MKIFRGLYILWSFRDLAGQSWHDQLHLEWDLTFRCPFWPALLWPSVVKTWLQGELCAQGLYCLRRCLLTDPCWVLFPSVQRSNAIAFSLIDTHLTFPLTSDGVSWQMFTYFYWMFHWYWAICFPFPLGVSDAVGLSFWQRTLIKGSLCMSAAQLELILAMITYRSWDTPVREHRVKQWG